MPRRDRSRRSRSEADTVGFAGWLYADLFLLLFVVGLAMSIVLKDANEVVPPRTTTTTTTTILASGDSTSTTTTRPPCSSLFNPNYNDESNRFDQGIYIELRAIWSDEKLASEFTSQLVAKTSAYPELADLTLQDLKLGFMIIYGGNDTKEELNEGVGLGVAKKVVNRLRNIQPELFKDSLTEREAVFRITQTTFRNRGVVGFDVYPLIGVRC